MKKLLLSAASLLFLGSAFAQNFAFEKTCYRGAFAPAPTPMWTNNWTEWDPNNKVYPAPTVTVSSDVTTNTTWSTGQTYLLTAPIYVTNNSILTIQPGCVILGDKSAAGAALIVTKGSQLIANGTIAQPIVFTSNQAPGLRSPGDWGGVILLGKAANNVSGGLNNVEGLPISAKTEFGGGASPDNNDNSGSLKYVRIEFGGYVYQPNQEINGITFGSVGRGTTLDFIQVSFANDDAFEWFGGTVNAKHLVSFRNLDDDFDTDNGWSGNVQFGLAVRDPQLQDNPSVSTSEFFESDNDATGTTNTPKTSGIFSNMTCIGPLRGVVTATIGAPNGHRDRVRIRRNSELKIYNSIFTDQATRGLFIDGSACENNALNGTLKFKNNILGGYAQRATESGTFGVINSNTFVVANANDTLGKTINAGNLLISPYSYTSPDYRPSAGSLALSNVSFTDAALAAVTGTSSSVVQISIPSSACIGSDPANTQPLNFVPASTVSPNYCSLSWSASSGVIISNTAALTPGFTISTLGTFTITLTVENENGVVTAPMAITTTTCLDVSIRENHIGLSGVKLSPNPSNSSSRLQFYSSSNSSASLNISDLTGKVVVTIAELRTQVGENTVELSTADLASGIYFVTLSGAAGKETVKLIVHH
jgi:hypothetical protein